MKLSVYPVVGESVVVRVKNIRDFGAFAELLEYPGKDGLIHKSNISTSWVKNIHSFLSEGDVRVAAVLHVDLSTKAIDLSLRHISTSDEKRKLEDWKREKRADKLFERFCHETKQDFKEKYPVIAPKFIAEFGDLLAAFENALTAGEKAFENTGAPTDFVKKFVDFSHRNITLPDFTVKGHLVLSTNSGSGIEFLKEALKAAEHAGVTVTYISAPKYMISATAADYAEAEKKITQAVKAASSLVEKHGGQASFERIKE